MARFFNKAASWLDDQAAAIGQAAGDAQRQARAKHDQAVQYLTAMMALPNAPRKSEAAPQLRGRIRVDPDAAPVRPPQPATARTPYRYLVDPTQPKNQGLLTTSAGADRSRSYINPFPASNLGVQPWSDAELVDRMRAFNAGGAVDVGPRITFTNDDPTKPTPYQPLTTDTARMVATGFWDSGLGSMNINSTTGGHGKPTQTGSRHNQARAVDINRINGRAVEGGRAEDVAALQEALARQANVRENFGPAFQTKAMSPGGAVTPRPDQRAGHRNHIHASGHR